MVICGVLCRVALLAAALVLVVGATPAQAAGCPAYSLGKPFLPWLDALNYTLVPNGGLESDSTSWTLTGGARVVAGNEPFRVRASTDAYSLSLPSGSSATTAPMCVQTLDLLMRFFAVNSGSLLSTLKVEALYTDAAGTPRAATVGLVHGTGQWGPTLPTLVFANVTSLPLVTDGTTNVRFRFTPQGLLGGWRIDDVYVDPMKEI